MAEENKIDTGAIESGIRAALEEPLPSNIVRPTVIARNENKNRDAMAAVDRRYDKEGLAIEAYVDEAIHTRICAVRGSYLAGPRDSYVRKMVLDAINSITSQNSHSLDR